MEGRRSKSSRYADGDGEDPAGKILHCAHGERDDGMRGARRFDRPNLHFEYAGNREQRGHAEQWDHDSLGRARLR